MEGAPSSALRCNQATRTVAAVQCASNQILQSAPSSSECEWTGAAPPSERHPLASFLSPIPYQRVKLAIGTSKVPPVICIVCSTLDAGPLQNASPLKVPLMRRAVRVAMCTGPSRLHP